MPYICANVQTVHRHIATCNTDQFQLFAVHGVCRFSNESKLHCSNALCKQKPSLDAL